MTVDYYNIKVKDAIAAPLSGDILNACFANLSASSATSPACTSIRRNTATGGLSGSTANVRGLPAPLGNNGHMKTDGVDLTANYRRSLGFGTLTLNFNGNWTHTSKFWASDTSTPPNCPGVYSANCGISIGQLQPKYSFNQRTTLSIKPVDISLNWRWIDKFHYEFAGVTGAELARNCHNGTPDACTITGTGPLVGKTFDFNHISAYSYFDLTTRWSITDHFDLTLAAFNIFDKKPPILPNGAGTTSANSGNTFPSTYDVLGRRYSASVRLKF